MKVNIREQIDISDEQRVALARLIDGPNARRKRQATREEIKNFVWQWGESWQLNLGIEKTRQDEDLIGSDDELDALL